MADLIKSVFLSALWFGLIWLIVSACLRWEWMILVVGFLVLSVLVHIVRVVLSGPGN